jgi:sigma-E factor negative regulatory protein RseC
MIEETATVVGLSDGFAIVETQQRAACNSCQSASGCSTSVLSGLFKRRPNQLKVLNPVHARPGDKVIIGLQESALLKVSMTAYLMPLFCMIVIAIGAEFLARTFAIQGGELPSIAGGLLGLLAGLMLFKRISARNASDPAFQAVILRLANSQPVRFA